MSMFKSHNNFSIDHIIFVAINLIFFFFSLLLKTILICAPMCMCESIYKQESYVYPTNVAHLLNGFGYGTACVMRCKLFCVAVIVLGLVFGIIHIQFTRLLLELFT